MLDLFKKYLLTSAAYRPDDGTGAGELPEDERIDVDLEDDEGVHDPEDEPEEAEDDAPDDAEGDDDAGAAPDTVARTGRARNDFAALRESRRQLSEQNATLTRQLDELRRNPPQPQQQPEDPRVEADRLALMSPEDRIQYTVQKSLDRHAAQQAQITNQLLDQSDKVAFDAQASVNPVAQKLAPEVERRLADLRSRGQNLPRQVVLTYLVGERALAQMGKKKPGAQERRRQQEARPVGGRGDAPSDRRARRDGGDVAAMERRLENIPI